MVIHLIAVGEKMPSWVQSGFSEYARRMRGNCSLRLVEIAAPKRGKNADIARIKRDEGKKILAAIPAGSQVIALEVGGKSWSTTDLSAQLQRWLNDGSDIALLVGGPDGLSEDCLQRANQQWSLSRLTLPHPLVRIVLAEQLYRAQSILNNHPYHRA